MNSTFSSFLFIHINNFVQWSAEWFKLRCIRAFVQWSAEWFKLRCIPAFVQLTLFKYFNDFACSNFVGVKYLFFGRLWQSNDIGLLIYDGLLILLS